MTAVAGHEADVPVAESALPGSLRGDAIVGVDVRTRTVPLPRPWGPDARENHVLVVRVVTRDGREGEGCTWTPTVGRTAVAAMLRDEIAPRVLGLAPHAADRWAPLWRQLHEAGGAGVTTIAMAGLDLALWDLAGREAGRSVTALLGQRHERLPRYGSGVNLHLPLDGLVAQVQRFVDAGFDAVKVKVGRPDVADDLERLRAVRGVLGPRRALMLDANQRWDLHRATVALARFADVRPAWIEEPLRAEDLAGHVTLAARTDVPIALGENLHTVHRFGEYLDAGVVAHAQPNVVRVGGITPFLDVARRVAASGAQLDPHLLPDLSAQLALAMPRPVAVEHVEDAAFGELGLLADDGPVAYPRGAVTSRGRPGLGLRFA